MGVKQMKRERDFQWFGHNLMQDLLITFPTTCSVGLHRVTIRLFGRTQIYPWKGFGYYPPAISRRFHCSDCVLGSND